jgi:hypothetical protein
MRDVVSDLIAQSTFDVLIVIRDVSVYRKHHLGINGRGDDRPRLHDWR